MTGSSVERQAPVTRHQPGKGCANLSAAPRHPIEIPQAKTKKTAMASAGTYWTAKLSNAGREADCYHAPEPQAWCGIW